MKRILICAVALALLLGLTAYAAPVQSFSGAYVDDALLAFHDGLAAVCSGDKWGYVDAAGNIVIDFKYSAAWPFSGGYAFALSDVGAYVCIDRTGETKFVLTCNGVYPFSEGFARFTRDGLYGVVDTAGTIVSDPQWTAARDMKGGFMAVKNENGWGYIKPDGTIAVSCQYDEAEDYSGGLAYVKKGENGYIIDLEGGAYLYGVASGLHDGLIKTFNGESYGFIDKTGNVIVDNIYDAAGDPADSRIPVCVDGLWGYMDYTGTMIIEPRWTNAWSFVDGVARVYSEGYYGFIDTMGNLVTSQTYEDARDLCGGRAAVCSGGKWGYIDRIGTVTAECSYEYASNYSYNRAFVRADGLYYAIDDAGQRIIFGVEPDAPAADGGDTSAPAEKPAERGIVQYIFLGVSCLVIFYVIAMSLLRAVNVRRRSRRY